MRLELLVLGKVWHLQRGRRRGVAVAGVIRMADAGVAFWSDLTGSKAVMIEQLHLMTVCCDIGARR